MSGIDVAAVRAQIPALTRFVWFQNGGVSLTPAPIARAHIALLEELLARGPLHILHPDEESPRRRASLARLARFFAVDADELALMRGVSEAFQTVVRGLSWKAGDRVVLSADEEAALLLPCLQLRDRHGVEVVKLPLVDDDEAFLAAARAALTPATKLVAVSHVTTDLGYRLPVRPLCDLARARGVFSFLDLAHSAGVVPYGLRDLGCDAAGLLSYKWMMAPYAAGALWLRRERLHDLAVTYAGGRAEAWLDVASDTFARPTRRSASSTGRGLGPWCTPGRRRPTG